MNRILFSSEKEDWSTPQNLFDKLDKYYHFEVDVCANEFNHKCDKYFTKDQDGLKQDWTGTVWCNPPYGRKVGDWVKKAYDSHLKYKNTIVMLLPARTDTKWFHGYIYNKAEIRFIKGRLKFGNSTNSAPFPSMIIIFK